MELFENLCRNWIILDEGFQVIHKNNIHNNYVFRNGKLFLSGLLFLLVRVLHAHYFELQMYSFFLPVSRSLLDWLLFTYVHILGSRDREMNGWLVGTYVLVRLTITTQYQIRGGEFSLERCSILKEDIKWFIMESILSLDETYLFWRHEGCLSWTLRNISGWRSIELYLLKFNSIQNWTQSGEMTPEIGIWIIWVNKGQENRKSTMHPKLRTMIYRIHSTNQPVRTSKTK